MPTSCDMCWALDEYGDYPRCRITEEQRGYNFPIREKRMDKCPLASVPPHGDLIDRDALTNNILLRTYIRFHTGETPPSEWMILGQHIIDAPTILEAEVEE